MNFLNPFFLFGSVALAVPFLIHLVRKEKTEIIPFSSLMFLLRVPKSSIRQQKIKNLLLMMLRLLLLALLVAAFARPYLMQPAVQAAGGVANRGIVLLLDNSYSMGYGDNFTKLKAEADKRISAMKSTDKMTIVIFNDKASPLGLATGDQSALHAAVSTIELSNGGTRFYDAFTMADRAFSQMGTPEKLMVVVSDFQRSGWNRSSHESVIASDVKTESVDLGVDNPNDAGIDSVIVDPQTSFNRTYSGRVIARIHNHRKDQAVTVPVSLTLNDKEIERKSAVVPANASVLVEYTALDLPLGYSKGRVRIEAKDALETDNDFLFTLNRRDKLKLLVVDSGRPKQSLYLSHVFSSSAELPFDMQVVSADSVKAEDLGSRDVVVINDVQRLSDRVKDRLNELRKTGQGQIVILGGNADLNWWNSFASLPVKVTQKIFVSKDRGKDSFSLTTYDRNHSIFKPFERSSTLTLASAQFFAYVETEPKKGASVLAKFENGSPVMVESPSDDRGMLVLTSPMDGIANDLPMKPVFLPLFHEMVNYLSRYSETRGWYTMGEAIPVSGSVSASSAAVINPKGERIALGDLAAGAQKFFTPEMPGFHEIRVGPDVEIVAVNPPAAESNLDRMSPEDLVASVRRSPGDSQQAAFAGDDAKADYARRQTGWWYLLLVALLAGIGEIVIANKSYNQT